MFDEKTELLAIDAWRAIDQLTLRPQDEIQTMRVALIEMQDRIQFMLGRNA
jgi:hypothetical protein